MWLGFFVCAASSGCVDRSPQALAREADAVHHTGAFSWLDTHRPDTIVIWHAAVVETAPALPGTRVVAAGTRPCHEAKADRAELLVVAPVGSRERDTGLDCGFAIFHDDGAVVIAPL